MDECKVGKEYKGEVGREERRLSELIQVGRKLHNTISLKLKKTPWTPLVFLYTLLTRRIRSTWLDIGYGLFFFFALSRSIKTQKRARPTSSHLDWIRVVNWIKDFIYGQKDNFFLRDQRRISRATIVPTRVANKNTGYTSSCPLAESTVWISNVAFQGGNQWGIRKLKPKQQR